MIYFVGFQDYIKIGYTADPIRRLEAIKQALPGESVVYAIIEGNRELEKELHDTFAINRARGEWFYYNDTLMKFIREQKDVSERFGIYNGGAKYFDTDPITAHRMRLGLTQERLATILGISRQAVCKMEESARKGTVKLSTLQRVAEVTGYEYKHRFVQINDE